MIALIATLATLVIGPIVVASADREARMREAVDGFIFVSIAGLVAVDILPHLLEGLGWWALLIVAAGLWGPDWLENRFRAAAHSTHVAVVMIAAAGLVVHTVADGAVLSDLQQPGLILAVLLHRFPVAMTVWWLLRPAWGVRGASLMLALMGVGTVAGYGAGSHFLHGGLALMLLEALVAGSILHVVFNRLHLNPSLPRQPSAPHAEGVGNLLGLVFLGLAFASDLDVSAGIYDVGVRFYQLALVAAPALLLGYSLAGLLAGVLPVRSLAWIGRGSTARQSLSGMLVGLPMPVCSCGVVPLYRSLIQRGVPPAAGLAFLIATPELGLDALIVSLPLLGLDMTMARLIAAAVIAWSVGALMGRFVQVRATQPSGCGHSCHDHLTPQPEAGFTRAGALQGLRYGYTDLFDSTMPWLVLGLVIAAFSAPLLEWVSAMNLPGGVEVLAFAVLGMPMYVCATGSTPIVAMMLISGVSPGASLAFLITGPATNPATFGLLSRLHGRWVAVGFGALVAGLAVVAGIITNMVMPGQINVSDWMGHEPGIWQQLSLLVLGGLCVSAILRRGARALVGELSGSHGG